MATIKIPPVLRASVGGEREVSAPGSNVGEVLQGLVTAHPATQSQLFGADVALAHSCLEGLETAVGEGDVLVILPAMAGG